MAPPIRLARSPHLDNLLQKNHELEHVVADLRHQLTQSSARWADERKTLAVRCDTLMASFAKFRARLDDHPSNLGDPEGEAGQNLDSRRQSDDSDEVNEGIPETQTDRRSSDAEILINRNLILADELQAKEEQLEESQRKREAAEMELQRIRGLLDAQGEQLQAALAKADTSDQLSPGRTLDDMSAQASSSKIAQDNIQEKLEFTNHEIGRLKQSLQKWKKIGRDWERDGRMAQVQASELQRREVELRAQVKAAEESKTLLHAEIKRLTNALADQIAAAEHQRTACQESVKRVQELEATVALLRARLSPEQLVAFDVEQTQPAPRSLPSPCQALTPHADADTNKRSDLIMLKIPGRSTNKGIGKPSTESNGLRDPQVEHQSAAPPLSIAHTGSHVVPPSQQAPASQSIRVSPVPQKSNDPPATNPAEFEVCIHTCSTLPCRNDSRSFLWPRGQPSLPRHARSIKKHPRCSPDCPGHRLLIMSLADIVKEPRRAKCRSPTEAELALAVEEAQKMPASKRKGEKRTNVKGTVYNEGPGGPEETEAPRGGSRQEEEVQEGGEERSLQMTVHSGPILGKRLRSGTADGEESQPKKSRLRTSITAKP